MHTNAAQVIIMTLNFWGHQYCGDWGEVRNWCVKLRVCAKPHPPLQLSSFHAFIQHQDCGDWGGVMNWCVKLRVSDYPHPHLSSFQAFSWEMLFITDSYHSRSWGAPEAAQV